MTYLCFKPIAKLVQFLTKTTSKRLIKLNIQTQSFEELPDAEFQA